MTTKYLKDGIVCLMTEDAFATEEHVQMATAAIRQAQEAAKAAYLVYEAWRKEQVEWARRQAGGDEALSDATKLSLAEFGTWLWEIANPEERVRDHVGSILEWEIEVAEVKGGLAELKARADLAMRERAEADGRRLAEKIRGKPVLYLLTGGLDKAKPEPEEDWS